MELSIGFINDVHGYMEPHAELFYDKKGPYIKTAGGYSRIASIFENIRNENQHVLFFDGGDTFHGTLPIVESKGEALIPILKQLGLSAMVGHWDFAYTPEHLVSLQEKLNYPVLAINVYKNDGNLLFRPYILRQSGAVKVAVIGICANIIDKTMPPSFYKGIYVTDGMKEINHYVKEVKEKGANLVVLLSHNGFPQDVNLIKNHPGIDVCLSAHTHNRLYDVVKVNDTIIIQCGCHGSFVGHLKLSIKEDTIEKYDYKLIEVNETITENEDVRAHVDNIMMPYRNLQSQIAGTTNEILYRYDPLNSSMDHLLLAAIKEVSGTDIAFSNGWRYGAPVNKGNITIWDLYNMIPMNPPVTVTELTGQQMVEMLEENLERTFSTDPMKQMGGYVKRCLGLQIKMRIENPTGYRIQEIYFNGTHLDKNKNYRIAFITGQGVPDKYIENKKTNLQIHTVEAIVDYLKRLPAIDKIPCAFSLV